MNGPLEDALDRLKNADGFDEAWRRHQEWRRFAARSYVVEAIQDFLRRLNAAGNPGARELKLSRFRRQAAWFIEWNRGEIRCGFWLTPDGRVRHMHGDGRWVALEDATFFGLDGVAANAVAAKGRPPTSTVMPGVHNHYIAEAEQIVESLAVLVKRHIGN